MVRAALVSVLTFCASVAQAADRLPASMLGKWALEPAACKEQSSELGMTVEPRAVLFYEHGNTITRLVRLKDGSWKGFGYSVDDQGRARDSITLKLVGDKLEVRGRMYHRCKDGA